jgi:hypothetical protein
VHQPHLALLRQPAHRLGLPRGVMRQSRLLPADPVLKALRLLFNSRPVRQPAAQISSHLHQTHPLSLPAVLLEVHLLQLRQLQGLHRLPIHLQAAPVIRPPVHRQLSLPIHLQVALGIKPRSRLQLSRRTLQRRPALQLQLLQSLRRQTHRMVYPGALLSVEGCHGVTNSAEWN